MAQPAAKHQTGERVAIAEAIVFIARANIRPLVKQELKAASIETIHTFEDVASCSAQLVHNTSLLVVDAELDKKTLNSILQAAQGSFNVDTRPILLITQNMTPEIVSYASEYNISRIHTGEISRSSIQSDIDAIIDDERSDSGLRNAMTRIADARIRGDWGTSEFLLLDLYGRYPTETRIACELAENYIHKNDWEQAKAIIESVPESDENLRVLHMKARCHMHKGEYNAAEEILQRCKIINPYNVGRLIDLGTALMNMTRVQEALQHFELALEIDASSADATIGKAQCKLLAGDVNEALMLMRTITSPRELASIFNNAAIIAIRQGSFENGMKLYKTAIGTIGKKESAASRLFYNLGIAYMKFGNQSEALSCFEKAASIDGTFYNSKHNANALAVKLGRKTPYPGLKPKLDSQGRTETPPYDFASSVEEEDIAKR